MRRIYILLILSIILSTTEFATAQWVQMNGPSGPNGSTVYCFAVSDTNIYTGGYGDGVFLSSDNGMNWTQVNNNMEDAIVRSLAVSGKSIFAGTDGGGVYRSTDNGSHWTAMNNGLTKIIAASFSSHRF